MSACTGFPRPYVSLHVASPPQVSTRMPLLLRILQSTEQIVSIRIETKFLTYPNKTIRFLVAVMEYLARTTYGGKIYFADGSVHAHVALYVSGPRAKKNISTAEAYGRGGWEHQSRQ